MSAETKINMNKSASRKIQIKMGPLDKMFSKSIAIDSNEQCKNTKKSSLSGSVSSFNTSSIQSSYTSSSFSSDPCTSSSTTDSSEIFGDENLDTCTCGRLQGNFTTNNPCRFCTAQIELMNNLLTQQQNDFLMAQNIDKELREANFEDYNLRKRPSSAVRHVHKKKRKLSKGQLTLKQILVDKGNSRFF